MIKDVKCAVKNTVDAYTREITVMLADQLTLITNDKPHVVLNNLHRNKIDLNREINLGCFHVPEAEQAWRDFHHFIKDAKTNLKGKKGLIIEIHGNNKTEQWDMYGYSTKSEVLDQKIIYPNQTSIRNIGESIEHDFESILRGEESLGSLMQEKGFNSIPSIKNKYPYGRTYYGGDYTIREHG